MPRNGDENIYSDAGALAVAETYERVKKEVRDVAHAWAAALGDVHLLVDSDGDELAVTLWEVLADRLDHVRYDEHRDYCEEHGL